MFSGTTQTILIAIAISSSLPAAVLNVSDSLRDYAVELRDLSLDDTDVQKYQAPSQSERDDFAAMAAHVAAGDLISADTLASGLGYEVVNFTDTDTSKTYYLLREATVTNGWGSYFYSPNNTRNVLVEASHIRHDTHSYDIATVAFANSGAKALLFNGAHRDSGGNNVADVAHLSTSIYQTVHETWTDSSDVQTWQFHGFDLDNHGSIPAGTDVVLSNGDGSISQEIKDISAELGLVSYINDAETKTTAYNTLDVNHADNVLINGAVDGSNMSSLGGTTNVQGIYTRAQGGIFVHIETEKSIRLDGTLAEDLTNRETAGLAFANAIQSTPEPSSATLLGLGSLLLLRRQRKA